MLAGERGGVSTSATSFGEIKEPSFGTSVYSTAGKEFQFQIGWLQPQHLVRIALWILIKTYMNILLLLSGHKLDKHSQPICSYQILTQLPNNMFFLEFSHQTYVDNFVYCSQIWVQHQPASIYILFGIFYHTAFMWLLHYSC